MVALGARVLISEPLYDRPCLEEGKNCKTRSPMYPFITLSMYSSILSANLFFYLCSPQKVTRRLQMRRYIIDVVVYLIPCLLPFYKAKSVGLKSIDQILFMYSLLYYLFQEGIVIVDIPGTYESPIINEKAKAYLLEASAFICSINGVDGEGIHRDEVIVMNCQQLRPLSSKRLKKHTNTKKVKTHMLWDFPITSALREGGIIFFRQKQLIYGSSGGEKLGTFLSSPCA